MPSNRTEPAEDDQSFTMRTDPSLRDDLDTLQTLIHARSRAETIRRVAHMARRLLEADPTRNDKVTVVDDKGNRHDIYV
jgi:hypothetical protein